MHRLQVVRARGRGHRARQVLHVRAARLREGGRLHTAVPGARLRGRDDRAAQLRRGHDPVRTADPARRVAEVVSKDPVTHDCGTWCCGWSSRTRSSSFPGSTWTSPFPGTEETRSFSMANTSTREGGLLEFVIKVYPDGLFSHFLDAQAADRGPAGHIRPVRRLHPARGRRHRPGLRRRRGRDGAHPVAAAVHGRARHQPQGHLLLRCAGPPRPVLREGTARAGRGTAQLPVRARAVRACRRTTTGTARPA